MALTISLTPSSRLFAGNPVKLSVASSSLCHYSVYVDDDLIYTGSSIGTFYVYIQDLIEDRLSAPKVYNNETSALISVSSCYCNCTVTVTNEDGDSRSTTFIAHLGGISRAVIRSLGTGNIFASRFLAASGNIFFTLRGGSDYITIRETEITPLVFIYPQTGQLSVEAGGYSYALQGTAGAMYALNLEYLRQRFFADHDIIPSLFCIKKSGSVVTYIGITPASVTRDRYYLRFLNSLGCYEIVEMTGLARRSTSEDTQEQPSYDVFDELVGGYRQQRGRSAVRPMLSVSTGDISENQLLFYQDMLSSDDVTLLGYRGQEFRVIPSSPELTFAHNLKDVQSFTVDLLFSDLDDRHSSDDIDSHLGDGRIHTSEFTDQFN